MPTMIVDHNKEENFEQKSIMKKLQILPTSDQKNNKGDGSVKSHDRSQEKKFQEYNSQINKMS